MFWGSLYESECCSLNHVLKAAKDKATWPIWCLSNEEIRENLVIAVHSERVTSILQQQIVTTCTYIAKVHVTISKDTL